MKPSNPYDVVPTNDDPTHDAISAWLLRVVQQPGYAEQMFAAVPGLREHGCRYEGIELEVLIGADPYGIADARLDFSSHLPLWVEIKTDDRAIGALVRQVKMYRQRIGQQGRYWLAILPYASVGAREFLAHAGIGVWFAPVEPPRELMSLAVLRSRAAPFDSIPAAA